MRRASAGSTANRRPSTSPPAHRRAAAARARAPIATTPATAAPTACGAGSAPRLVKPLRSARRADSPPRAELRRLKELERRYKVLKEEHELLKKAIRFASGRKRKSSSSSK